MTYTPGPYDQEHIYVQWGGKLPGNEQWSCGIRLCNFVGAGHAATDAATMMAPIAAAVRTFHMDASNGISSQALLSIVKCNAINTLGHYSAPLSNQVIEPDVPGGAGVTNYVPNQVALVATFTTGFSRGLAHSGRIYLPMPGFSLTNGAFAAANALGVATAVNTFRTNLAAVNADWKPAVFSRKLGSPTHNVISGCKVGRVYDTQRRRRRSLLEDYQ